MSVTDYMALYTLAMAGCTLLGGYLHARAATSRGEFASRIGSTVQATTVLVCLSFAVLLFPLFMDWASNR